MEQLHSTQLALQERGGVLYTTWIFKKKQLPKTKVKNESSIYPAGKRSVQRTLEKCTSPRISVPPLIRSATIVLLDNESSAKIATKRNSVKCCSWKQNLVSL